MPFPPAVLPVDSTDETVAAGYHADDLHNAANQAINDMVVEVQAHEADTTNVHGIPDTSVLATSASVNAAVSSEATTRATQDGLRVLKAGDTMTGPLVLPGDASNALHATPLQQVQAAIAAAVANLINGAPGALDALNELAAALGNDPNFATTITNALAAKAALAGATFTGPVAVPDDPYDEAAWNGSTNVATKNALRDKIETLAPKASPTFTGTPAAPTAAQGTNTAQLANTEFVNAEIAADAVLLAGSTSTGEQVAPSFKASGKTGATATPVTLAGGTASGAPSSGAHVKGELVMDDTGAAWYCTVAGTPGTWVAAGKASTIGAPTPTFDTTNGYGVPGFIVTNDNNQTGARGIEWTYTPLNVTRPITLTKVMKRTVATLGAQIKVRFALYACDSALLAPAGAPLYDFEVIVANGTAGGTLVTQVLNTTLQPGIYLGAFIHDSAGGYSWSAWLGHSSLGSATNSFGNGVLGSEFVTTTYPASAPTPPLAPTGFLAQTSTFYQWSPA